MVLPVAMIPSQITGDDPLAGCPTVMFDDADYLFDDPRACFGSITVITPLKSAKVEIIKPHGE